MQDVKFSASANPAAKTSLIDTRFTLITLSTPEFSLIKPLFRYKGEDLKVEADLESAGLARLNFEKNDLVLGISGGKSSKTNTLNFKASDQEFQLILEEDLNSGSLRFNNGDAKATARFNPETQSVVAGMGGDSLRIANLGSGAGVLNFHTSDLSLGINTDSNQAGKVRIQTSETDLELAADMGSKTGTIDWKQNDITIKGSYEPTKRSLQAAKSGDYLHFHQNGTNLQGGARQKNDSLTFNYQPENLNGEFGLTYKKQLDQWECKPQQLQGCVGNGSG